MPKNPLLKKLLNSLINANTKRRRVVRAVLPFTIGILIIAIPLLYFIFKNPLKVKADWWPKTENGSSWRQRRQLTIANNSPATINAGTAVAIDIDTKSLYELGKIQSNCKDLRIVYQSNATTFKELPRFISIRDSQTCATSGSTKVYFDLEATLAAGASSTNYYLYYDNMQSTLPTSTDNVFDVGSKNAALVCPLDGSTTCAARETNAASSPGPIQYSGTNTALSFNGHDTSTTAISNFVYYSGTNLDNLPNNDMTFETWFYWRSQEASGADVIAGKRGATIAGWRVELSNDSQNVLFRTDCGTNDGVYRTTSNTIQRDQWNHIAVTWDASAGTARIFLNGVEPSYDTPTACTGGYLDDSANTFVVGRDNEIQQHFPGMLDEMRISNTIRYTSNFTPSTAPFVRDNYTKLLYHFDENGTTPLGAIVTDDSGQGSHGISNGELTYESGVVGTDTTGETGAVEGGNAFTGKPGVAVEEGTTNEIPNPSFEHTTYDTNWVLSGGTGSDNTNKAFVKFGAHSYKVVLSDASDRTLRDSIDIGNTNTNTLTAYVYRGTSGNIGGVVDSTVARLVFNGSSQTTTYTNMGGGWWRMSYTGTPVAGATTYGIYIAEDSGTLYVDGLQLEEKDHATSYADGSLGTGYAWTGTVNDSNSTRDATFLSYPNEVNASAGTVNFWVKSAPSTNIWTLTGGGNHQYAHLDMNGGWSCKGINIYQDWSQIHAKLNEASCGGVELTADTSTYTTNTWYMITVTYNGSGTALYINGSLADSDVGTSGLVDLAYDMYLGSGGLAGSTIARYGSVISDFRLYTDALSATEVSDIYNSGGIGHAEDISIDAFSSTKGQDPVAIYRFDEAYGNTAHDASTYGNDLTITNATWDTSPISESGHLVRSLRFDGNGDYAKRAWDRDFDFGSGSFTISGWFRHSSTLPGTGTYDYILSRYGNAGYKIYMNDQGNVCFAIDGDSTWSPADYACSTSNLADAGWHQVTAVKTANTSISLYIDGALVNTDSSLTANGSLDTNQPLYIGIDSDESTGSWDGNIDQLIIYPYARSANQIQADIQANQQAIVLGQPANTLAEGLVGYWKMEEVSAGTGAVTRADSSGNGFSLTDNNTTSSGAGKFGNAASFSSANREYLTNTTTNSALNFSTGSYTFAAWVNPTTLTAAGQSIMGRMGDNGNWSTQIALEAPGDGAYFDMLVTSDGGVSGMNVLKATGFGPASAGNWYFVVGWYDGVKKEIGISINGDNIQTVPWSAGVYNSTAPFAIGERAGSVTISPMNGRIDEARVYKRVLSRGEIKQLYNWSPGPVGYWKMDENSGNVIYDSSGNSNNSTTWTGNTSWTNGRFGSGLSFDGNDDVVRIAESNSTDLGALTDSYTVETWFKTSATYSANGVIVAKNDNDASYPFMIYVYSGDQKVYFRVYGGSDGTAGSISALNDGQWHHAAGVRDIATDKVYLYIDGVLNGTGTDNTTVSAANDSDISIGNYATSLIRDFNGQVDDVRIYNYARTAAQVTEDMNAGHPIPGSPVGSALGEWNMDEGTGDTAHNSGNTPTINLNLAGAGTCPGASSCPTWTANSKYGKALIFDGTNDFASTSTTVNLSAVNKMTLSFWMYWDAFGSNDKLALETSTDFNSNAGAIIIDPNSSGGDFEVSIHGSGYRQERFTRPSAAAWHHYAMVFDSSTLNGDITIYVDGIQQATTVSTDTFGGPYSLGNYTWYLMSRAGSNLFGAGKMDELKVYTDALTADQIKMLYATNGAQTRMGAEGTTSANTVSNSDSTEFCVPGDTSTCRAPVGWWKFDENQGTTAADSSGSDKNGTLTNMTGSAWTQGKKGTALRFVGNDASTQSVSLPDDSFDTLTEGSISLWFKPDSTGDDWQDLFGVGLNPGNGWYELAYEVSTSRIYLSSSGCSTGGFEGYASLPNPTQWHNVVLTVNSSGNAMYIDGKKATMTYIGGWSGSTCFFSQYVQSATSNYRIGCWTENDSSCFTSELYEGLIDDVKLYDYALSPAQVAYNYTRGAPIAWYQFDECSGTTVHDSAPKADPAVSRFDGTITPNTGRSAGTCSSGVSTEMWNGGASGKFNASLSFDGSGDYISLGDNTFQELSTQGQYSVSTWVKTSASTGTIISQYSAGVCGAFVFQITSGTFYVSDGQSLSVASTETVNDNRWHNLVSVTNGTNTSLYIDGKLVKTGSRILWSDACTTTDVRISGRDSATPVYFNGQIDDVQIFNYALTQAQIQQVMNQNSSTRFGP